MSDATIEKKNLVVLGVCAHADDLDAGAGGTFAKWAEEGASCHYLVCTNGSSGCIDPEKSRDDLINERRKEQLAAAKVIGIKEVHFLDYNDTELVADMKLKKDIVFWIRKLKPDIVVTTDPTFVYSKSGFINHSDHRAAGLATLDAIYPLAGNAFAFRELNKDGIGPHKVPIVYLINFVDGNEMVDITTTIGKKERALSEHKSQALGHNTEFARARGRAAGAKAGYEYAESFIKLDRSAAIGRQTIQK
jgi:LmbE family N-acetylglucosaminyl deacetylase